MFGDCERRGIAFPGLFKACMMQAFLLIFFLQKSNIYGRKMYETKMYGDILNTLDQIYWRTNRSVSSF